MKIYKSLRVKTYFFCVTIVLVALTLATGIFFIQASSKVTAKTFEELNAIANIQKARVRQSLESNYERIAGVTSRTQLRMSLLSYLESDSITHKAKIQKIIRDAKSSVEGFEEITVLGVEKQVIYSTGPESPAKTAALKSVFERGRNGAAVIPFLSKDKEWKLYLAGPFTLNGTFLGVAVITTRAEVILNITGDYTGLGETGETLLAFDDPDTGQAEFIGYRRFEKAAVDRERTLNLAMIKALSGEEGLYEDVSDYRGVSVLAATRAIPELGWGIVVKKDKAEALRLVTDMQKAALLTFVLSLIPVSGLVFLFVSFLLTPMKKIREGVDLLGQGNLDARINLHRQDEWGSLAAAFDRMTENLKKVTTSRDKLNREIHQRRKAESELRLAKKTAEEANRAKSNFLATMSHELRTPLNSIIGFSRVLQKETFGPLNDKQKSYIGDVWESGNHLLDLINDILDLAKIEAGKMKFEPSEFNLKKLVRNSIVVVQENASKHGIKLSLDIDENIGTIEADERKVKQSLFNLLSNAAKFTPKGGRIGVEVKKKSETEVEICVWDTGIGIEKKDEHKIFSEFEQVDSVISRQFSGTGLGMPLTKRFVEMHGGKIGFESEGKDRGTRVHFTLPLKQARQTSPEPDKEKAAASVTFSESKSGNRKMKVLVIEDDANMVKLFSSYLHEAGYEVEAARSGEEGFEKAKRLKPDIITLDLSLPGKDGRAILADLKSCDQTQWIPVIVITSMDDQQKSTALWAEDYLVKPITEDVLLSVIKKVEAVKIKKSLEGVKILVVDDDEKSVRLLTDILKQKKVCVQQALGGRQALESISASMPDLVLLDLMMPEVSGFDVLNKLRNNEATENLPVIVVTAKDLTSAEEAFLNRRVQIILKKPGFNAEEFLQAMEEILQKNKLKDKQGG